MSDPSDYVTVPRKPTPAMIDAVYEFALAERAAWIWEAMITAAPVKVAEPSPGDDIVVGRFVITMIDEETGLLLRDGVKARAILFRRKPDGTLEEFTPPSDS